MSYAVPPKLELPGGLFFYVVFQLAVLVGSVVAKAAVNDWDWSCVVKTCVEVTP